MSENLEIAHEIVPIADGTDADYVRELLAELDVAELISYSEAIQYSESPSNYVLKDFYPINHRVVAVFKSRVGDTVTATIDTAFKDKEENDRPS